MPRDLNNPETKIFGRTIREFLEELSKLEETLLRDAKERVGHNNGQYSFKGLHYNGHVVDVKLVPELIKESNDALYKTVDDWWKYRESTGKVLLDVQMAYQIGKCLMHAEQTNEVQQCAEKLRKVFDRFYISGAIKISYKSNLETKIESRDLDGRKLTKTIQVPEFTKDNPNDFWTYLVLAKRQAADRLGNVESIPENAKPFLQKLFGERYEEAGAVFQYLCSPHENNDLREVRIWVPALSTRPNTRAVVLGVVNDDRFNLNAYVIYSGRPALSVVVVGKKNCSSGNRGS